MRRSDALPVCRGQRIPDARDAVTRDDPDQARGAVPSMKWPITPRRPARAQLAGIRIYRWSLIQNSRPDELFQVQRCFSFAIWLIPSLHIRQIRE